MTAAMPIGVVALAVFIGLLLWLGERRDKQR
jgi:hypothetical protein